MGTETSLLFSNLQFYPSQNGYLIDEGSERNYVSYQASFFMIICIVQIGSWRVY